MKYVVFDPMDGPEFFETEIEAKEFADSILAGYRETCYDGWDEDVEKLEWGRYEPIQEVRETNRRPAEHGECDEWVDYVLEDVEEET